MGGGGGPSPPPFSAAGIHRKTHEKRAFQGIKQQKKAPALVRIGYDQRTRARFAASSVRTVWLWWTWWRTEPNRAKQQAHRQTKKHKESAQLRFPCALWQTVFGRYSMPFQYSTSEPERQIHNAAVAGLAAVHAAGAEELHQHGLHPLGLFDLPQSIRQGDLHSDPAGVLPAPGSYPGREVHFSSWSCPFSVLVFSMCSTATARPMIFTLSRSSTGIIRLLRFRSAVTRAMYRRCCQT